MYSSRTLALSARIFTWFLSCSATLFLLLSLPSLGISQGFSSRGMSIAAIIEACEEAGPLTEDPEQVIRQCSELILDPSKDPSIPRDALYRTRARASLLVGKCEAAKDDYQKACELAPGDYASSYGLARAKASLGQIQAAAHQIEKLIAMDPKRPQGYYLMAKLLTDTDVPRAISFASQAIVCDTSYALAYSYRAFLYTKLNDPQRCLADVNQAIQLSSLTEEEENLYVLRASALCSLGRYKDALPDALLAKRLNPKSFGARVWLWYIYRHTKRNNLALLTAQEMKQLEPAQSRGHFSEAVSLYDLGREEEAQACCKNVRDLVGEGKEMVLLVDACVDVHNGRHREALGTYDVCLQQSPGDYGALTGKALVLAAAPETQLRNAEESWRLARSLHPESAGQRKAQMVLMAILSANSGRFEEAVNTMKLVTAMPMEEVRNIGLGMDGEELKEILSLFEKGKRYVLANRHLKKGKGKTAM